MKKLGGGWIAWSAMFLMGSLMSSFSQIHSEVKTEVSQQLPGAADNDLKSQLAGEWEYRFNDRLWRRRFNEDGTIELWLEGKRDGTWLSDLRWKVRKQGDKQAAEVFRGEEKIAVLKWKGGGKELNWEDQPKKGGPHMTRVIAEDFWKR